MRRMLAICCLLVFVAGANAAIVGVALGSGARTDPLPIGPYSAKLLPADTSSVFATVTSVPGSPPLTGPVGFSIGMSHRKIGSGWATWSPGSPASWDKSVYYTNGAASMTVNLPAGTAAFVFYAEPNPFGQYTFTVKAQDGTTLVQDAHGSSGAAGFGFYGTGGSLISSLTVSSTTDFAIGEFYGAVPEPTSLGLLAVGALALLRRR